MVGTKSDESSGWPPFSSDWGGLPRLLQKKSAFFSGLDPLAASTTQLFLQESCKVLVIGAGGLGCEILKDLALSGFRHISVVDMDVIDVSNLNRQFLFRAEDVGKPKATVAANFINKRVHGSEIVAYHQNIMSLDREFYSGFKFVVSGLDSIEARRWLNAMLVDLAEVDDNGNLDHSTVIPMIDGGTEGFLGSSRVIVPRLSPCFECILGLFPPARNFPLCTIANTPRLPEHCIEYAHIVMWNKKEPFGKDRKLDTDDMDHMTWIFEQASCRADEFGIQGVTLRLTQGVVKRIIPAIASTNAIVAACCAQEALKLATYISNSMDNYMMYNGSRGIYSLTYHNEKRPNCPVCGIPTVKQLQFSGSKTLAEFIEMVALDDDLQCRNPMLRSSEGKTLYAAFPKALRAATERNLTEKMGDLLDPVTHLILTDSNLPMPRKIKLTLR